MRPHYGVATLSLVAAIVLGVSRMGSVKEGRGFNNPRGDDVVDPYNEIKESNENNNVIVRTLSLMQMTTGSEVAASGGLSGLAATPGCGRQPTAGCRPDR